MNQTKRPASAGVSRKTFAPEPVLFYPNFNRKSTTDVRKGLSDESVIKYNSRPSSASCVNRIFKKDSSKPSKDVDKSKCFLRISTSPLPYTRSPSPSPSSKLVSQNKAINSSRPLSASKSAVSIAKSSSTFKIGLTNENFKELIEKNMIEQKKGRPPFQKTFTTQLGEESDEDSREEYTSSSQKNQRPRSVALQSARPWSSSTASSMQRYSKKSRMTETPRFSGNFLNEKLENPDNQITTISQPKFNRVSELTSPHGLSRSSLPTSDSIEKKVANTPRKYANLKTTVVAQYSSSSSFDSSSSMKKSTSSSSVKNPGSNRATPCTEGGSDSGSDYEELDIKPYEVNLSELRNVADSSQKNEESKPNIVISRTGSYTSSRNSTPSSTPTNSNALNITAALSEKQTQPTKTTTPQSRQTTPTASASPNRRRQSIMQSNPYSESFGFLGEEFESALMDSTAILKTHILALPKTKNQLQRSPSSKKMGNHSSPQIRNDFLLSRNKFITNSFAKAAERQNKAYTNLVKADRQKNKLESEEQEQETITSIQLMEKDIVYTTAAITFNDEENMRIDLNIPVIDTKGGEQKQKEKITESKTTQFSHITKSINQVLDNWGHNIQTAQEKEEYDSIINDAQAIEKMANLKQSVENISGYGSKSAMKTAKKSSEQISRYIIEQDPSFFGFEVSKTFLDDLHQKKQVETEDDIINIIKDYKQDISESKNNSKSSDSEEEAQVKKASEHRPLTLGKEKRRKINQKILNERIAEIKKYSWKYAELENRVKEIKKDIKEKEKKLNIQDHIKLNTARQSFESIQAKKDFVKEKFSDRREKALVTFQEQEKKRCEVLETKFEEKEKKRQNASSEKMSKLYKQRMWKLQKTWFPIIKLALFITQLSEPMLEERHVRRHYTDLEWAHSIMKKRLLPYILQRREQRQKAALEVIRKNWLIYVINFRVRRKTRAARLIESFVNDINKTNRIVRAVSRFVTAVKKIQRFVKHFLFKRRIHLYILNEQYKRCERELIKNIAKEDFQEVRFKIVDVLKKMKETAFFEEPSTATETRAIQRKQNSSPSHSNHTSGFSDDTTNVRRTKLAVTEAKKNLKAVQKLVMDELKDTSTSKSETKTNSPRGRKFSFLSTADAILRGSDKWNKGLDDFNYLIHIIEQGSLKNDIIFKVGKMLRITPRKRSTKTQDDIRMKIVREDLARRMKQIRVEEEENEKRKERNVIALNEQNKKFTEIQKRAVINSDITNQLIAKQMDIIEEEEDIERANQELQKKKSVAFVPSFYMDNLVRQGLEQTLREEVGNSSSETSKSTKKKSTKSKSRRSSFKDSLAEERENDFLEYEKLLQDLR